MSDYHYPRTKEEWWHNFDAAKQDLRYMVKNYHPGHLPTPSPMPITAVRAEAACIGIRKQILEQTEENPLTRFDTADFDRDAGELIQVLNETWFGIPESYEAHSIPGFGVLCDLCSEGDVALPELPEDE